LDAYDHAEPHGMAEGVPDALKSCTRRSQEFQPNWMPANLAPLALIAVAVAI